jgi:uncharacterized protein (UPF0216 family)
MKTDSRSFSLELLSKDKSARLDYFQCCVVEHTRIQQVKEELISYINNPTSSSICLILGLSGVGKTTLGASVEKHFVESMLEELKGDLCRIPIVRLELVSSDSGVFNWKDYYRRILECLQEPLITHKVDHEEYQLTEMEKKERRLNYRGSNSAPELRKALENALKYRKPVAIIIDEAQHLLKVSNANKLQNQLDTIKSMANMTNVPHILIGTYELKEFINLSGQLSRRTIPKHFQRYLASDPEEYHTFLSVVYLFQRHLPVREEPKLVDYGEYLYERTLGCVGILKDWLTRCLGEAIDNDADTITLEMLNNHALSISALTTLFEEIDIGEQLFIEDKVERMDLLDKIGLRSNMHEKLVLDQSTKKSKKQNKKPFSRNPVRDQVGDG